MPLPDERPRGSVANLIGRFENQVKRQPSSSPVSARSLSVVSHISGDSTKEEAKDRREWPPKSVSPDVKPPILASSSFARSLAIAQAASADTILGTPVSQPDIMDDAPLVTPRPSSVTSNPGKPKPIITPQRQLSIDLTIQTPTTAKPPMTAKPPPGKTGVLRLSGKPTPTTSARIPVKPTGRMTPSAQPVKPQNTGPGGPSSPARKPVTKPTPAPSANASKTPVRKTATPSSNRPKTPSLMISKMPSSGLFAPTAASLAKSRNAQQPPVPTPTKKIILNSAVAERLSKPTAASLSRARTPTAVTPSRAGVKPAAPASSATRGTPASRPRTSATGMPAKKLGVTPKATKAAAAAATAETGVAAAASAASDPEPVSEVVVPLEENGHQTGEGHVDEHPEDADNSDQSLPEENGDPADLTQAEAEAEVVAADEHLNGGVVDDMHDTDAVSASAESESHDTTLGHSEDAEAAPINAKHETEVKSEEARLGTAIEDMVNLLESVSISKVRPESIASIPDEE